MRPKLILLAILLATSSALARAALPELADKIVADQPIGCGTFKWMMEEIYRIKLWSAAQPFDIAEPYALSITYNRSLDAHQIAEKSLELMGKLAPGSEAELSEKYLPALITALHAVKRGDRITALFTPPEATIFYYNGEQTAVIQGRDFMQLLAVYGSRQRRLIQLCA